MKKFTLTLVASLLILGGVSAQEMVLKRSSRKFVENSIDSAKPSPVVKKRAESSRRGPGSVVAPFYATSGMYDFSSYQYPSIGGEAPYRELAFPVIVKATDDKLEFVNFFDNPFYADVKADGTFVIPGGQQVGSYYGGYYPLCLYGAYVDATGKKYLDDLTGEIVKDKKTGETTIVFDQDTWWDVVLALNATTNYDWYVFSPAATFAKDTDYNGIMELEPNQYFFAGYGTQYVPVILEQNGNILTVGNFAEYPNPVDITLNADRTVEIPLTIVDDDDQYYYITYAADWDALRWLAPTVEGTGNLSELNLGAFGIRKYDYTTRSWTAQLTRAWDSAKIYYVDDVCQRYDYTQPSASLAPRFGFGGDGTTGIQSAKAAAEVSSVQYVDMAGRQVNAATKGLVLKTVTYADGTKKTVKVINK